LQFLAHRRSFPERLAGFFDNLAPGDANVGDQFQQLLALAPTLANSINQRERTGDRPRSGKWRASVDEY